MRILDQYVTLEKFSEYACIDGRLWGVKTSCDNCELTLNACLHEHAKAALEANQRIVENYIGFCLTDRYHEEEITYRGEELIQLSWKGLAEVNVSGTYEVLATGHVVDPYLVANVTTTDMGEYCLAEIDSSLFLNPNHAKFYNASTGAEYKTQPIPSYPRRNSDGNWLIPLNKPYLPPCSTTVSAAHCKYVVVDTPLFTCNGELVARQTGTDRDIPFAKTSEIVGNSMRHWFYLWSLTEPSFIDEGIDYSVSEYYKLIPKIDFLCRKSSLAPSVVTKKSQLWELPECVIRCSCEISGFVYIQPDIQIVNNEESIIRIVFNESCCALRDWCRDAKQPSKIRVYYKTSPSKIQNAAEDMTSLKEAICYISASELPLSICRCEVKTGFIFEAQALPEDLKINPITGVETTVIKYGERYGKVVFRQRLSKVPQRKRLMKL